MTHPYEIQPCQCEHIAHLDRTEKTPHGNPGHTHGQQFAAWSLTPVRTRYGTFVVCGDCALDCLLEEQQ